MKEFCKTAYTLRTRVKSYNFASQPDLVFIGCLIGNEAVQVLKLVLILFRTFGCSFVQI